MTSAPGPARPMTDAEIVREALLYARSRGVGYGSLAALARLAACAERGERLAAALEALLFIIEDEPESETWAEVIEGRAALAGAAPEPEQADA